MRRLIFVLSTIVLFAFCSCTEPAGDPITKEFEITGTYTELDVSGGFNVTVSDAATQITVTTGENVMPKVVVELVGQTLRIYVKPVYVTGLYELNVVLPYNADLKSVNLSGASSFQSAHALNGLKAEVDLSGSSSFYCDLDADLVNVDLSGSSTIESYVNAMDFNLNMSGASDATLTGHVTMLNLSLSGTSHLISRVIENKYSLVCGNCKGELSGSSSAYIHCDGNIIVDLSGASDLHYSGDADTSGSTTSGGSNIFHEVL